MKRHGNAIDVDPRDASGLPSQKSERALAELAFGAGGRTITNVRRTDGARDIIGTWDLTPGHQ
jgi:hypothetical protein